MASAGGSVERPALTLKGQFLFEPSVVVSAVPYSL